MANQCIQASLSPQIGEDVAKLAALLMAQQLRLVTAESCTGGLLASTLTDFAGSSQWFWGGVVAYHNAIKHSVLHVPEDCLLQYGAVSLETVTSMAEGVCSSLGAECAIATSGIAGPDGGTPEKPVGTVCIATLVQLPQKKVHSNAHRYHFLGNRAAIKRQTVEKAILQLYDSLCSL